MTVIISLFYFSLVTIIAMVSWKLVFLRDLKVSPVEGVEKELHGKLYEAIHRAWRTFKVHILERLKTLVVNLFFTIAHEVLRFAGIVGEKIKARHGKWFDLVKGKGEIRKKGSVSFFLRDVAEYKKSLQENDGIKTK